MKKTLLFLFISFTFIGFGQQTVWNQLPTVPVGPVLGSTAAEAGDVIIADDGTIYTAYMWDDGGGLQFFIAYYDVPSLSWENIHSEYVYDGFHIVKSRKHASEAYFTTITGPGPGTPILKVFKASAQTAYEICYVYLTDYYTDAQIDFEMANDPTYGFLLYKNAAGTNVNLSRVDYSVSTITTQSPTVSGITAIHNYDMTTIGDSVFMMLSVEAPLHKLLLLKSGPAGNVIAPYVPSAINGEVLNAGNPISTHDCMINSDHTGKVFLQGYDFGNMAGIEKVYENGAITNMTWYGNLAEQYSAGMAVADPNVSLYLNNYSPSNSAPYKTYVMTHDPATFVRDTIGAPGNYILSNNAPTEHRMGYCAPQKRIAVSYWETALNERQYYLSNELPYISPSNIDATDGMCELQSSNIYTNLGITDENGDQVLILGVSSSDPAVLDPSNVYYISNGMTGNESNYFFYGVAAQAGTVTLTIEVTDGWDTLMITLPAINVVSPTPPTFSLPTLEICSGQGEINLFDYISQTGGTFYNNSLEIDFPGGLYDTDNSPFSAEDTQILTYDLYDGACQYSVEIDITYHISPSVSITNTPTACGLSTGTATALVSGGATPYVLSQWSSGQQNVNNVSGLSAGQHSFMLTDNNTCVVTKYFNVLTTGATATGTVANVACNGQANGSITLATTGLMAPIVSLWSSGQSTLNLSGVPAGTYTVDLTDAAGCALSKTFTITEPEPLVSEVSTVLPNCEQADGTMEATLTTGGTTPYTYAWSNGDTGPLADNVPFGIYSLTTTDNNGCMAINTVYMSELGAAELYGTVTSANCGTSEGAIDVSPNIPIGENVVSIAWSNGESTEDIENLIPAVYICTLEITNNCTAVKAWEIETVEPLRNDICVVTVDSATTTNLVVWEPVQLTGIAYYNIYRESSVQGEFILIDTVHADNLSLFNDVVASPLVRSWRYKISAVNGCDQEGPLSPAHQTIHLDVLDPGTGTSATVNWNAYQGAAFSDYVISRYTDATATWSPIATVPATQLSYTDNTPFGTAGLDYMVEVELDEFCTAMVWRSQDFNSARSNKDKGQFSAGEGTGDSNNDIAESYLSAISVSPNPTNGLLDIRQAETQRVTIQVRSVDGQLMETAVTSALHEQLDLSAYANGIYFVTLVLNDARQTLRIVKH